MYRARESDRVLTRWRWSALLGLATLIIAIGFAAVPGIDACGPAISAGQWVDFQNSGVLRAATTQRAVCVGALKASMWLDAIAFIPAYAAFLSTALLAAGAGRRAILLAGIGSLIVGVISDQVEGVRLLGILNALPGTTEMIAASQKARHAKEAFLQLSTLVVGTAMILHPGSLRLAGIGVVAASALALLGTLVGFAYGENGLLIAWLILFLVAAFHGFRKGHGHH
jgi:hypothetical protein